MVVKAAGIDVSIKRESITPPSLSRLAALSTSKDPPLVRNAETVAHAYAFKTIGEGLGLGLG